MSNTKAISDIKIIVIGRSGTGKTSFVNRWLKNEFSDIYKATIVSEFKKKQILKGDKKLNVQLWDLGGQDRGATVTKTFCKGANGCLIMAEVNSKVSLDETLQWKNAVDDKEVTADGEKLPCILLENKADLLDQNEMANDNDIKEFGKSNGFIKTFRTSAKTGLNVNESMDYLINLIDKKLTELFEKEMNSNRETVNIDPDKNKDIDKNRKKQGGCC